MKNRFEEYVACAKRGWEEARANAEEVTRRYYSWGTFSVCLEFAGPSLVSLLTRGLAFREVPPVSNPSLTIGIWEEASTGRKVLPTDASEAFVGSSGSFAGLSGEDFEMGMCRNRDTTGLLDRRAGRGYFWASSAAAIPIWELSGPLRLLLHWWLRPHGLQVVHGAVVGKKGKGVLLVGKGGSGKSTTAFACLRAGMDFLGEDYCLISAESPIRAQSLFSTGKLTQTALDRFPDLAEMVEGLPHTMYVEKRKKLFYLESKFRSNLKEELVLQGILIPEVTQDRESSLIRVSSGEGLRNLAPNTLLQLPLSGALDLRQMARMVEALPVHRLRLGSDLDGLTEVVSSRCS